MDSRRDDPWQWLGLRALEGRVLERVILLEETTAVELAAALEVSANDISTAVRSLQGRGLLDRTPRRRPAVVFLHERADEVVANLRGEAQDRAARVAEAAAATQSQLGLAAQRRRERGRPGYEWDSGPRDGPWSWDLVGRARRSCDEVLSPLGSWRHWSRPQVRVRLLLTRERGDLELLMSPCSPGSEVRVTEASLPEVCVLDGNRVGLSASHGTSIRKAWSGDALHVGIVSDLFEQWWAQAAPGWVVPPRPSMPEVPLDDWDDWDDGDVPPDE